MEMILVSCHALRDNDSGNPTRFMVGWEYAAPSTMPA
jgi:hypothetical protein